MTDVVLKGSFLQQARGLTILDGGGAVWSFNSQTNELSAIVTPGGIADFNEAAQDAVGGILTDSSSVDFTYDDAGNAITAAVLPAGVDHDALANFVADEHVAHSGVTLTAGAGLTGGGTIAASRTFNVGAGAGITVNANDVAIDFAFAATWTGAHIFNNVVSVGVNTTARVLAMNGAAGQLRVIRFRTAGVERWRIGANTAAETGSNAGSDFTIVRQNDAGADIDNVLILSRIDGRVTVVSAAGLLVSGVFDLGNASDTRFARIAAGRASIAGNEIGFRRTLASTETSGALTAVSAGRAVEMTAGCTINNSVFAQGDTIMFVNTTDGALTITQGSGVTLRQGTTTGNVSVPAREIRKCRFVSASDAYFE